MGRIIFAILFFAVSGGLISCKKDIEVVSNPGTPLPVPIVTNRPPVANAGSDIIISLPDNKMFLNGFGSYDPDGGKIVSYLWEQISGPFFYQFTIHYKNASSTNAELHIAGTYQFQLTVVDNGGLAGKDTVQVIVNDYTNPLHIRGQEVTFNNLVWKEQQDDDNPAIYYVWMNTPVRPDLFLHSYMKVEVWLQPNPTAGWIKIKPWFENDSNQKFTFSMGGDLQVDMWPSDRSLVGQKASLRIKFL